MLHNIVWRVVLTLQAENMIVHRDEIYSRPKRTWFVTEKEKKLVQKAAKVTFYFVVYLDCMDVSIGLHEVLIGIYL